MTKHLRRLALATLLLGSTLTSLADRISREEAQVIAAEFMSARTGRSTDQIRLHAAAGTDASAQELYYVFNVDDNKGFVIISAESSATPVLGYSFEGAYAAQRVPDAMRWVMDGLEREIKAAPSVQGAIPATDLKRMARKAGRAGEAEKLLSTPSWSQEAPFNSLIPGRPLVGCVGTAMATVMKYHQYPQSGKGSFDGVDFSTSYDWASMRDDNYRSGYTAAEGDAVATLMYHASKSIDTQYAMSGSSAYEVRVPAALSSYFGYDPGVSYKKRSEVASQDAWDRIVKDEIDAGRPVIYCGQDVTAGHAFVCDGYQGEYLHFNWGWGGSANGYFLSTALNPTVSRTHHYNNLNTIIYNIKPGSGAISEWSPVHITADAGQPGIGSDLTDLASGETFKVRVGNLKNLSYDDFSGKIAVALYGADGNMKALLSSPASFSLASMATLYNGRTDFSSCRLPAGTAVADDDVVRIATQASGSDEWLPVAGELPTVNELAVRTSAPASFTVLLPAAVAGVSVTGENSVIRGWDYTFSVVPENADEDVITVKANGYVLTPGNDYRYTIANVCDDQNVTVIVQKASEVRARRSIWVETPGTLSTLISEAESGTITDLSLFGSIDARDFAFMRGNMRLQRVDLSGVYIAAHGTDQANAIPREAFRGMGSLQEAVLPKSVNRLNNGCFRQTGLTSITIPAGVKTYEYNVFVAASRLQHIYVGRETAEFINWCVLSGVNVAKCTLHVPSERAVANYSKAENWNTIGNIIVDPIADTDDVLFAVMDDADVMYDSETMPGRMDKGSVVTFKASYIPENDNRMAVYANSTLLTPDAEGVYSTAVNANTIIHFGLIEPTKVEDYKSQWTLTGKNGSVGLLTDAVNVIPGQEFQVRVNTLDIPQYLDQLFWAMALTDASGNIKEFISPVNVWTAGPGDTHKLNVNCCVREANVREGNTLRLVTSVNKRNWALVHAASDDIVDAIPALNNQTPVYNINVAEVKNATVSGVTETAVRGRDLTLKIVPVNAAYRVDLTVNGEKVLTNQPTVNYTFVAMQDMDFEADVYDPKEEGCVTYNVSPGELYKAVTQESIAAHVVVTGEVYSKDLSNAFRQDFAARTIKKLDLSGVTIVANVLTPTDDNDKIANYIPANLLYNSTSLSAVMPVVEEIILPNSVTRIEVGAFRNCSRIKEITLPRSLTADKIVVGQYASGSPKYGYALGYGIFEGCTSLTTIYLPCAPTKVNGRDVVSFYNPYGSYANGVNSGLNVHDGSTKMYDLGFWIDGKPDASRVTLIVPEEHLNVYRTKYADSNYGNPWVAYGYNILSENPVYGVNFDPSRVKVADDTDVTAMASFLGDDIALESITAEGKLMLVNPDAKCRVYDNGVEIELAEDGSIPVTFYNPAKNAALAGSHDISVVFTHDVTFASTSPLFTISEPEVSREGAVFDSADALNPVLRDVQENSTVRFKVDFSTEHERGLEARVMAGNDELQADAEGYYTLAVTNAGKAVDIFAVPGEGAILNADDLAAINHEEAHGVTSIALEGEMTAEDLENVKDCFPYLETLDLSGFEGELPEGIFSAIETLSVVTLPEIEEIPANLFSGCTALESVEIPASVTAVGEGAFRDCKSLESIKLTGIDHIGADAFNGCDNLTTITLLADAAAASASGASRPARAPRAGLSDDAFAGINPNCFIVLDEGVKIPAGNANVLLTSSETISEEQPDGSVIEREGRVYSAASDIAILSGYPLAIPHAFTLADEASISLKASADKWTGLVVPFDVQAITGAGSEEVEITLTDEEKVSGKSNYLYTFAGEDDAALTSVAEVKANVPYYFFSPKETEYTFSATGIKVSSTPASIEAAGKDFSLRATYASEELPAAETYLLTSDGMAFEAAGAADDAPVKVRPFEVYATSPEALSSIESTLPEVDVISSVEMTGMSTDGVTVAVDGDRLVINASSERVEKICDLDGHTVMVLHLNAGRNEVSAAGLDGVYVVAGIKIML
ncbi:MAG: leucine-rich repeat protein [Bacteroides sp.]|nr:leucine-rich repeat protein [Bacteroides sp.]